MSGPAGSKVIVSCAITGAVHIPSQTPHLPITPAQIAGSAVEAAEAGAAIVHLHARDPLTGAPCSDPDVFAQFIPEIGGRCDAVINISTGGGLGMALEDRTAAARRFRPELCSLNMGSMNFGIFGMAHRVSKFQHEWEPQYLEMTRDLVFKNTFKDIEAIVDEFTEYGTRFEFECYDIGHLHTLAHFLERGLVQPPLFVQAVFGILGGIGPEPAHLLHFKETADRLFGDAYRLSALGAGRHQMRLITIAALLGTAGVRVGIEDSIFLERGLLAERNADQVAKIIRILRELSLEPATPQEARELLALKGADRAAAGIAS
jgi:uncharacterized protein (DUF849 family)